MTNSKKRKTRPQKRFFKVGIIASIFAVALTVGVIVTSINLPHKNELSEAVGQDYIENIAKGQNNSYYVIGTSKQDGKVVDGNLYHFSKEDELISKFNIYSKLEEKYGVKGLPKLTSLTLDYENDSCYVTAGKYLISLSGVSSDNFAIQGYTNDFYGDIRNVYASGENLFVVCREGSTAAISKFKTKDPTFTKKASGYIYNNDYYDDKKHFVLSPLDFDAINTMYADNNDLYIFTKNYLYLYNLDFSGCNYKTLFTEEYNIQAALYPEKTVEENKLAASEICKTKYNWKDYNYVKDEITIDSLAFKKDKFSFFKCEDKFGAIIYDGNIVMLGKDRYIYSTDLLSLKGLDAINNLDDQLRCHYNLYVPYDVALSDNALSYYNVGNTAVIRYYDTTNCVSVFHLNSMSLGTTVGISTSISEAFINEENNNIYYKFTDKVNRDPERKYLCSANVDKEKEAVVTKALLITFSILLGVAVITLIVCFAAFISKKSSMRIIDTGKGIKKHWPIYVIIIPSFALLCLFCYYPGISAIITSFFDYKPGESALKTWNNFGNYVQIFGNAESLRHFGNMIIFLIADLVLATIPPLIFAFFLSVLKAKKLSGVLRTLLFIPGIIPGVAGVLIWKNCIYGPYGLLNTIIVAAGGTRIDNFFDSQNYLSIISLIMMGFPFVGSYLIFYGSIMNIPSSYYEAAELDGITVWKRFFKIDLPLSFPQLKYVIIMTIIASIQNFSRIWIGMGGDPGLINTPITKMYDLMYTDKNYGLASAYATVLFVILFGLTFVSMRKKASNQIK